MVFELLSEDDNSYYFPAFLRVALATMPHLYTANMNGKNKDVYHDGEGYSIGQDGVAYYKWFNGSIWGADNNYSKVLELCQKAGWDRKDGKYSRTYWNNTVPNHYSRGRTKELLGITPEEWANFDSLNAWNVENWDDFYKALASATCGYQPILAGLLTSDESWYDLKVDIEALKLTVFMTR